MKDFTILTDRARVMYTLATSFLLPPQALELLASSIELYRQSLGLTDSPILQMDAGFNLAQSDTALADMLDEVSGELETERIRALRMEAVNVLEQVLSGQEAYLIQAEQEAGEAMDGIEGGADTADGGDMQLDESQNDGGEGAGEGETEEPQATYETHLPTASALIDTALSLIDVHLALWESVIPLSPPDRAAQDILRSAVERAGPRCPPGRQAELDLAEIKILLTMDQIVWDIFKSDARIGSGTERSLEGAIGAVTSVLGSLDAQPADEPTVRAEITTTLASCHSNLAHRLIFLAPQLPAGPNNLAQQAWYHYSQTVALLGKALDSPSAGAPREFKPSVLLDLARASLSRARLAEINDTAKRNLAQLVENATAYAARAGEALGMPWVRLGTSVSSTTVPEPAGWDAELLGREIVLQQVRTCLYASEMDLAIDVKGRLNEGMSQLFQAIKRVSADRRVGQVDVERWIEDIVSDEGSISEKEREWWTRAISELSS